MKYMFLSGFMYEVGDGVGEYLAEEEKDYYTPMTLKDIVREYSIGRNVLNFFLLKRDIKKYIKSNMGPDGLEYVYPPFDQETSFPEDYFEGDLYVFLTSVLDLLDSEIKLRLRNIFVRKN